LAGLVDAFNRGKDREAGAKANELDHRDAQDEARRKADEIHNRPVGAWNDTVGRL
jgi:hypothetical protein